MTEEKFNQVKNLIDLNLKNIQIMEILKVSGGTVCSIKRNKDFASYKAEQKAYFDSKKVDKTADVPQGIPSNPETPHLEVVKALKRIEDQLIELNSNFCKAGRSKGFRLF